MMGRDPEDEDDRMTMTPLRSAALATRHGVRRLGDPAAAPLVLAHGFGTDSTMWSRVTPALAADAHVVLFDHAGAGASDPSLWSARRHASLEGYAEDVVALLDELALGPVAFVGHSASAMIGVLAAGARPDLFSDLVLVGGSPRYLDDPADGYTGGFTCEDVDGLLAAMDGDYLSWSRSLAPLVMGNPDRPELADELADSFARADTRAATSFARAIFLGDHRAALARVRTRTLVVQPAEDPMVPVEVASYLSAGIAGSELVLLSATGHFPHVSGVDETTRVVRAFLGAHHR